MPEDTLTLEQAAAIWDNVTQQFMQLSPTVRFATAVRPEEHEAIYRARYAEVISKGWATPEDLPEGIERDAYDDTALHLVGWIEDEMVITGRVVLPSPDRPLPTEAAYDLVIAPQQQVVDTGRAILIQTERSDARHKLFLGLMGFAWQEMRARGFCHVCATMTASMLRMYRIMGIHWDVLGDPRPYWGQPRYPCKHDLVQTVQAHLKRQQ